MSSPADAEEWTERGSVHPLLLQELRYAADMELGARARIIFEAFDLEKRVPMEQAQGIWRALEAFDDTHDLGARIGRHYRTANYIDVVLGALSLSEDLPQWVEASARYYPFLSTGATVSLVPIHGADKAQGFYKVVCSFGVGRRGRVVRQTTLRATLNAIRAAVGADVVPEAVRLTLQQSDESLVRLRELFGCPVEGATGEDALIFPAELLDLTISEQPLARHQFRALAQQLVQLQHERDSLQHRVVTAIHRGLPDAYDIDMVADAFGWSVRTLQRELKDEGLTFRELCRKTRNALALDYLASGCSVSETARLVGYDSAAAFSRAYRHVIGRAPNQERRRARLRRSPKTH